MHKLLECLLVAGGFAPGENGEQGTRLGDLSFEVSCMLPIALEKLKERLVRTHSRIVSPR